jgi:DNA adenine methylase
MNKKLTPPLKYHGGKSYLAHKIIELMPKHLTYAEPFFGGGAVLMAKDPEGISEVVNDIDYTLMNFWGMLRNPLTFYAMQRVLEATPFGQPVFGMAQCDSIVTGLETQIRDAIKFFIVARQSLAGRKLDFAPISVNRVRRGMNEQASAWLSSIEGLPAVHERMKRVVIMSEGFERFIKRIDNPKTLFYCDPPYIHQSRVSTREYGDFEMSNDDHELLLKTLACIKGKFILSGYDSDLYRQYAKKHKWKSVKFDLPNNSAGGKSKRRMVEVCWMNY